MEQSSTSPATNNAIRGAEQRGNIAKQRFAQERCQRLEVHGNLGRLAEQKIGNAA